MRLSFLCLNLPERMKNYCSFRRSHAQPVRLRSAMPAYSSTPASPVLGELTLAAGVVGPGLRPVAGITVDAWVISVLASASA